MYTALRLMMKGCQFSGKRKKRTGLDDDYLGMAKIEDTDSAWFGCIPIPRMVANQVNHRLELRMKEIDSEILKDADDLLQTKKQHAWVVGTLALFLVLHIRELDAGRNIFWKRYKDPVSSSNLRKAQDANDLSSDFGYIHRSHRRSLRKQLPLLIPSCRIIIMCLGESHLT
jgi:hypothetical protein